VQFLTSMAVPVELSDRASLIKSASTSLNSKVRRAAHHIKIKTAQINLRLKTCLFHSLDYPQSLPARGPFSLASSARCDSFCARGVPWGVQVVSQHASLLAPLAVDCVLAVSDPDTPGVVDLRDIKVLKKLGGHGEWQDHGETGRGRGGAGGRCGWVTAHCPGLCSLASPSGFFPCFCP